MLLQVPPGQAVYVTAAVYVTGSTRPTVVSVTGPPRPAAVYVTGSTRPTVVSVTGGQQQFMLQVPPGR